MALPSSPARFNEDIRSVYIFGERANFFSLVILYSYVRSQRDYAASALSILIAWSIWLFRSSTSIRVLYVTMSGVKLEFFMSSRTPTALIQSPDLPILRNVKAIHK